MLVFLDESGDPGMKMRKGSSRYFTVACVLFHEPAVAQACDRAIAGLRKRLDIPEQLEFHFSHTSGPWRQAFLKTLANFEFMYFARTIDKTRLSGRAWHDKAYLYQQAARLTLEAIRPFLSEAIVAIDKSSDRTFDQELAKYLKKHAGKKDGRPAIREVRAHKSHKNNLMQAVDMVCGAVARSYTDKKDRLLYRALIRSREQSVEVWP